ncbi:hypothetical protein GCM10027428_00220 [Haliea atlantica]
MVTMYICQPSTNIAPDTPNHWVGGWIYRSYVATRRARNGCYFCTDYSHAYNDNLRAWHD